MLHSKFIIIHRLCNAVSRWSVTSYNRCRVFLVARFLNRNSPSKTRETVSRDISRETPAEHIGNALAILQLTGTRVMDRADDGSVIIVPLADWEAAMSRLHRALLELRFAESPDVIGGRPSVSGDTRRPTRNSTARARQADLDSARDTERLRAYFGPQLI